MKDERDGILDTLSSLRTQFGIYHFDFAGDNIDRYLSAKMVSNPDFNKQYDYLISAEIKLKFIEERISDIEREYASRLLNLEQFPSLIQIIEKGQPSTYKARPKRSLYLLGALAATFIFSLLVVLVVDAVLKK